MNLYVFKASTGGMVPCGGLAIFAAHNEDEARRLRDQKEFFDLYEDSDPMLIGKALPDQSAGLIIEDGMSD